MGPSLCAAGLSRAPMESLLTASRGGPERVGRAVRFFCREVARSFFDRKQTAGTNSTKATTKTANQVAAYVITRNPADLAVADRLCRGGCTGPPRQALSLLQPGEYHPLPGPFSY